MKKQDSPVINVNTKTQSKVEKSQRQLTKNHDTNNQCEYKITHKAKLKNDLETTHKES